MVTPLPRRRPAKLARETASLDHLSGGRLILGIGAIPYEYDYLGEEADTRVRGAMLDEGLEVLTGLWSGEPFGHGRSARWELEVLSHRSASERDEVTFSSRLTPSFRYANRL